MEIRACKSKCRHNPMRMVRPAWCPSPVARWRRWKPCRAILIFTLVLLNEGRMQLLHRVDFRTVGKRLDIEAQANLDVFLREVVAVDQHFADLVGGIGIFALVGVVVLEQELAEQCSMTGFEWV